MEIDKARLPLLTFGACCVLAVAVALVTGEWVAALALAIAGLSLAFAMRAAAPGGGRAANPNEDPEPTLEAMRAALAERDAEIETLRDSVDGLAEIVETIIDGGGASHSGGPRLAELSAGLRALEARTENLAQTNPALLDRVAALETGMSRALAEAETRAQAATLRAQSGGADPVTVSHAAMAIPSKARGKLDTLRDMAERGGKAASHEDIPTTIAPLFGTDLKAPRAYIVTAETDAATNEAGLASLRRACALADEDGTDCFYLPRIDAGLAASDEFAKLAIEALDLAGETARRVLPLTTQAVFQKGNLALLQQLSGRGMGFVLEDIRDWSLDLASLAHHGLRYLMVDGPAMIETAIAQKGDPSRLKAVLSRNNIGLIATGIDGEAEINSVAALQADLLHGAALAGQRQPEQVG